MGLVILGTRFQPEGCPAVLWTPIKFFGVHKRKIHLISYNFMTKHAFQTASFQCLAKSLIRNSKFSSPSRLSAVIGVNCIAVSQKVSTFLQKIENQTIEMLNDLILAVTSNTFFVNELCKLAEDNQPNTYKNFRTLNKKAVYNIHLKNNTK